jgi:hypothetical protein
MYNQLPPSRFRPASFSVRAAQRGKTQYVLLYRAYKGAEHAYEGEAPLLYKARHQAPSPLAQIVPSK